MCISHFAVGILFIIEKVSTSMVDFVIVTCLEMKIVAITLLKRWYSVCIYLYAPIAHIDRRYLPLPHIRPSIGIICLCVDILCTHTACESFVAAIQKKRKRMKDAIHSIYVHWMLYIQLHVCVCMLCMPYDACADENYVQINAPDSDTYYYDRLCQYSTLK